MDYKKIMDSLFKENFELEHENEQLKEERESMISDFQKKLDLVSMLKDEIYELKQENKALRLQADTYFEQWQNEKLGCENEELK